ncbi:MAG: phosphotransferase family protein [Acidimicrobiales bacterium]
MQGVNRDAVSAWLTAHVDGAVAPFTFELIAGGHSNLTYAVTGADGRRVVLRRPPLGHVLASAHDMGREHRIISALAGTKVPVAPALGYCDDIEVNGAPFYVMGFVDSFVVRDQATARAVLEPAARRHAGESLADTLAAIHAVDPDAVGLGDLGRKEGYIERQLKRWYSQWTQSKTRELPAVDDVYRHLSARIPEQGAATIVHGDYRLDNCMVDAAGDVVAVLDWEICTLGDPMADVGLLKVYWSGPHDAVAGLAAPATAVEGFLDRDDVLARYASASGCDLSRVDFYVAFAYWKLACIVEGVYARYLHGAMGADNDPSAFDHFRAQVERSAENAAALCAGIE